MIYVVTGKPRAGKSFFVLKRIVEELAFGHRCVVTNLSIHPGRLSAYLQKHYPDKDIDLLKRFRLLTDAETKRFYLYRRPASPGSSGQIDGVTPTDEKAGIFPSFPAEWASVFYVIDEAHIHFDARRWLELGHSLTFYNSQHGKLDDQVFFVTQFLDLIDKRVKGFAQEYIYVVNQGLRRVLSYFSPPSYMVAKAYAQPVSGTARDTSEWTVRYRLDIELAGCYDTSAGVGISGLSRPETKPKKGASLLWFIPAAAVLYFVIVSAGKVTKQVVTRAVVGAGSVSNTKDALTLVAPKSSPESKGTALPSISSPPPTVRWVLVRKGIIRATLSDGTELSSADIVNPIATVTARYVVMASGHRYLRTFPSNKKDSASAP